MNKLLAKNFLNKELADLAKKRKDKVLPEQSDVVMADIAKVKVKEKTIYAPVRP
jgi:hypothetical protein